MLFKFQMGIHRHYSENVLYFPSFFFDFREDDTSRFDDVHLK